MKLQRVGQFQVGSLDAVQDHVHGAQQVGKGFIFNTVKSFFVGIVNSLYEMIEGLEKFISGTKMYIGSAIVMGLDLLTDRESPKFVKDFFVIPQILYQQF